MASLAPDPAGRKPGVAVKKPRCFQNRLVLNQLRHESAACHVMYDDLALELPEVAPARTAAKR